LILKALPFLKELLPLHFMVLLLKTGAIMIVTKKGKPVKL
jgi:hypothetical protein